MARPTMVDIAMHMAEELTKRATCQKAAVGAAILDAEGRVIGSGYNGVPRGYIHCTEIDCGGAKMPAGSDSCMAVHAEKNAILNCKGLLDDARMMVVTRAPCLPCTKFLANTNIETIYYQGEEPSERVRRLWNGLGRALKKWS